MERSFFPAGRNHAWRQVRLKHMYVQRLAGPFLFDRLEGLHCLREHNALLRRPSAEFDLGFGLSAPTILVVCAVYPWWSIDPVPLAAKREIFARVVGAPGLALYGAAVIDTAIIQAYRRPTVDRKMFSKREPMMPRFEIGWTMAVAAPVFFRAERSRHELIHLPRLAYLTRYFAITLQVYQRIKPSRLMSRGLSRAALESPNAVYRIP
jgi:hypothetical protein